MKPADALAHKHMALAEAERLIAGRDRLDDGDDRDRQVLRDLETVRDLLPFAEVFYVSAEMTALVKSAARTLPRTTRSLGLLRATCGFMLYDAPVFRVLRGEGESEGEAPAGVPDEAYDIQAWMWAASLPGDGEPCLGIIPMVWAPDRPVLVPVAVGSYEIGADIGTYEDGTVEDQREQPEARFWTTHLMMSQTLAAVSEELAPRAERRRAVRAGLAVPPPIKIVTLRLIERPRREAGETVDWSHRWFVDGHWRQHWYPSAQEHRPLWIGTHVKGPADRPLVVKEKVTAWVR